MCRASRCSRSRTAMRGRSMCRRWWPGTLPIPVRTPCRQPFRHSGPGTRAAGTNLRRSRSRAVLGRRASRAKHARPMASTVLIPRWWLRLRVGLVSCETLLRWRGSGLAAQAVLLAHGLELIGWLALEHGAGGGVAAHLAVFHVEPIEALGLGDLDDLSKAHLLGRARRIVDAPGVFVAVLPDLRQPEVFVVISGRDRDLDRQLGYGRLPGTDEREEPGQGFPRLAERGCHVGIALFKRDDIVASGFVHQGPAGVMAGEKVVGHDGEHEEAADMPHHTHECLLKDAPMAA